MTSELLVSIVVPVYNQERYLTETLDSLLAQTYKNVEFIVVNDGSTDGSRAILNAYEGRVKIIDQANSGQAVALNNGWAASSGDLLGYLSADDTLASDCIERLVEILSKDLSVVCAFPGCDLISEDSRVLKRRVGRPFDLAELVIKQECYIGPGALWRASAHEKAGGWKSELILAPDRDYWMRIAPYGKFHYVADSLAGYRLHPLSISYKTTSEIVSLEFVRVLDEYFARSNVPPNIAARSSEAYANAYWVIARNMIRDGNFIVALKYLKMAKQRWPRSFNLKNFVILTRSSIGKPIQILRGRVRKAVNK